MSLLNSNCTYIYLFHQRWHIDFIGSGLNRSSNFFRLTAGVSKKPRRQSTKGRFVGRMQGRCWKRENKRWRFMVRVILNLYMIYSCDIYIYICLFTCDDKCMMSHLMWDWLKFHLMRYRNYLNSKMALKSPSQHFSILYLEDHLIQ